KKKAGSSGHKKKEDQQAEPSLVFHIPPQKERKSRDEVSKSNEHPGCTVPVVRGTRRNRVPCQRAGISRFGRGSAVDRRTFGRRSVRRRRDAAHRASGAGNPGRGRNAHL